MYDLHDAPFKIDLFAARHSDYMEQKRFTPSLLFSVETTAQRTSVTFIAIVLEVQSCSQRRFLAKIIRNLIKSSGFITPMHVMRTKKNNNNENKKYRPVKLYPKFMGRIPCFALFCSLCTTVQLILDPCGYCYTKWANKSGK